MKTRRRVEAWLHRSSPLHWMKVNWQLISPAPIIPSEIATGPTGKEGGWVSPGAGVEVVRKISCPLWGTEQWPTGPRLYRLIYLGYSLLTLKVRCIDRQRAHTRQDQRRPGKKVRPDKGRPDRTGQDKTKAQKQTKRGVIRKYKTRQYKIRRTRSNKKTRQDQKR
jgi:hypothetical protein